MWGLRGRKQVNNYLHYNRNYKVGQAVNAFFSPFREFKAYNQSTTGKLIICQFEKISTPYTIYWQGITEGRKFVNVFSGQYDLLCPA